MKEEIIENIIEETLLGILQVYGGDPNIWQHGYLDRAHSAVKMQMLGRIVNALCTVDSYNLSIIRAVITDTLDSRGYGMTDECKVCGVYINRSANDELYDTVPLCANHIVVESPILKKLYSMMSNEDKQRYFDLEKRQEYYNRYVLGKGDDE